MAEMSIGELKQRIRANRLPPGTEVSIAKRRAAMEAVAFRIASDIEVETATVDELHAQWLRAPQITGPHTVLYLHGGGYVMGSCNTHRALGGAISRAAGAAVLLPEYRLAPEAAFPAAVDDAVACYRWLLARGHEPAHLAIAGDSAGGGLTAATLIALRKESLPMPAAAVCISPWSDLTCNAGSYRTRAAADPMITPQDIAEMAAHYLQGADPESPLASPNFADLRELPPLLIHVGRDEILLDDALQLHERATAAGVASTLEVWDDMIHVWHAFHPLLAEGRDGVARVGAFLREQWSA